MTSAAIPRPSVGVDRRRVRICYFNTWAGALEDAAGYVARVPSIDLGPLVSNPRDPALLIKARLDCDWYGENVRCFSRLQHDSIDFLPAWVCGPNNLLELANAPRENGEERWLITMAHQPQVLGALAGKAFELLARGGIRHCYYAFDEASREMPCFNLIAPHLDLLIHDEAPLASAGRAALSEMCRTIHRSWVANVVPFSVPFNEAPEEKIVFLGSQLGLTPHRQRQLDYLRRTFKDRVIALHDHTIDVAERGALRRYKVGFCPEGRKFTTAAMARTHTDRPFWSGCLGLAPVSEDSKFGKRLEELQTAGLIVGYAHGDLKALGESCERALALLNDERRRIFDHFNQAETVGTVVAAAIAATGRPRT